MLTVQVNYLGVAEQRRHNQMTEGETVRHNKEQEALGYANLDETVRHNKASESIDRSRVQLGYDNLAFNYRSLDETRRANMARESLQRESNLIQAGGLTEAIRTHKANEAIAAFNAQSNWYNALTSRKKVDAEVQRMDIQSAQGWQSLANQRYANYTDRMNAYTSQRNASTNEYNAQTERYNFYNNVARTALEHVDRSADRFQRLYSNLVHDAVSLVDIQ